MNGSWIYSCNSPLFIGYILIQILRCLWGSPYLVDVELCFCLPSSLSLLGVQLSLSASHLLQLQKLHLLETTGVSEKNMNLGSDLWVSCPWSIPTSSAQMQHSVAPGVVRQGLAPEGSPVLGAAPVLVWALLPRCWDAASSWLHLPLGPVQCLRPAVPKLFCTRDWFCGR